ncbi:MAG: hypothetical protein AAFP04_00170 [Myxococcota bacterium]
MNLPVGKPIWIDEAGPGVTANPVAQARRGSCLDRARTGFESCSQAW